ncbi:ATP-dependent helicase [Anaerocolumna sp. AGMB13020]|uniref:ATP-dependent helicase n=1 Tax=Anaerocolumna sp. AGMB13020 TaxID=3081750 RepID=UPI0029539C3E|nr:ATP-dependent helicase [Anaerocolumna sp. AGMB13020]WOO35240.1 ATP-dependent helicase [Anaerocolumna sp. AGMB13020]
MEINQSQLAAIRHYTGPMMVLAGPGSGKTLVITRRVQELIEHYGVNPANILVITFTKAAAEEMKERFFKLTGHKTPGISFGTFHSVFFTILKYAYGYNASNIIREEQRYGFIKEIIHNMSLEAPDEKEFSEEILSEISLVKGERLNLEHYYSVNCSEDNFKKIYQAYESKLAASNLIDFDDMLVLCLELLTQRPDILTLWQNKYQYILIDEFQDINKVQYDVIRLLAGQLSNLFIVGDDDQAIYRFRGAKPEIMLNFEKDYPACRRIELRYNYRCGSKIVQCASALIKNNNKRYEKEIKSATGKGGEVAIRSFENLKTQNLSVVGEILKYNQEGIPYSQIAVLFRTNIQPRALVEKMMEYNIPFHMRDRIPNLYEHWIAQDIIAYIKLAAGELERRHFLQIANRPNRYISRECMKEQQIDFLMLRKFYGDKDWMLDRIDKLEYDLNLIRNMNPYGAVTYIRRGVGYEEFTADYARLRNLKSEELIEILDELAESAKNYDTFDSWFHHMEEYKEELKVKAREARENNTDMVTLATMHSSKGLEYKVVFIIDANESITPYRKAVLEADMEEERRLFYVAATRAMDYLHIYSSKERYNKELTISRFVGEMLLDRDTLTPGTLVEHKTYGKGQITARDAGKISIHFEEKAVTKTMNLDYCIQNRLLSIRSDLEKA